MCLHGKSLSTAFVGGNGFALESGRKPGLRATKAGSHARLRVRMPHGLRGTWVHIGFLQSWRKEMGRASLTCEPPCLCSASAPAATQPRASASPLWFDGWKPSEHVSVTKIAPFYVASPAADDECILRLEGHTSGAGGSRFVLSDLISGAPDPGPLTWAFDVAGSLLLHETELN